MKNEVEIVDRISRRSISGNIEKQINIEQRTDRENTNKWISYQNPIADQYKRVDQEPNTLLRHLNNSNSDDSIHLSSSNFSHAPVGSVKLPFIPNGESPNRRGFIWQSYSRASAHQFSSTETQSYAIGVGKTTSSNNLKATVSGGKFSVSGIHSKDDRQKIEFKCSPTGTVKKISPSKMNIDNGDPKYNHYYHKFRQQNKESAKSASSYFPHKKQLMKNKFPLPFTGVEYPFIDGAGINNFGWDDVYNDFEKSWLYSLPDKFACTTNERPTYKKKMKMDNKINKIVYDSMNSSPYYSAAYESEHNCMIDMNREPIMENRNTVDDQKSKTDGLAHRKDRYYSYLLPYYALKDETDSTLIFESRFESGNLRRVFKKSDYEYELMLKTDYNTNNYTQWFYYKVSNIRKGVPYTFKIINMIKPDSLYNHGMKVLSCSTKAAGMHKIGWKRVGKNISYAQNNYKRKGAGNYYTLSFNVTFEYDGDTVYFSHWFPYTFTDLKYMLSNVWTENMRHKIRKTYLARTLAGNEFEGVIITDFESSQEDISERDWVVITGRVHPGESNASFIVEGIIKFLVSDDPVAHALRATFIFKIVPMLNPDGVIIGNYRCSLSGNDLNRQWKNPSPRQHPEIYAVKDIFVKTFKCRNVFCYIDIHGHSRKKNAFMYGCNKKSSVEAQNYREKVIPFLFSHNSESFSFKDCNFTITKAREGTARYVVHKEYQVVNSYTLEASFFGPEKGLYQDCHFTPTQLQDIGKRFWFSLREYSKMVVNPNIISVNSPKNIGSDLQKVFLEIDSFFGVGRETQSKNYLKFMSKGDESDSADDDEPDFFSCGK